MTSAVLVCVALVFTSSCLYECVNGKVNYVHWGKSGCPVAGLTDVHGNYECLPIFIVTMYICIQYVIMNIGLYLL